jgi:ABC-type sugar transport system, permease component
MAGLNARNNRVNAFDVFNYVIMILLSISIIYPLWEMLVKSFSTPVDVASVGFKFFPKEITFDSYKTVFQGKSILMGYFNTIFRVVVSTAMTLLVTVLAAYPLSKKKLPYRNGFTLFMLFTMFFSGGLIPSYLVMKWLSLIDNRWSLILPGVASIFYIIIMRNYMMFSIDKSIEESAEIDGANQYQTLFRIIVPVSTPVLATIALWTMVGNWNSWFDAMIYINSKEKEVLQLMLRKILIQYENQQVMRFKEIAINNHEQFAPESLKAAYMFICITPILCVYPFLQKYFVKGIMIGSLKG